MLAHGTRSTVTRLSGFPYIMYSIATAQHKIAPFTSTYLSTYPHPHPTTICPMAAGDGWVHLSTCAPVNIYILVDCRAQTDGAKRNLGSPRQSFLCFVGIGEIESDLMEDMGNVPVNREPICWGYLAIISAARANEKDLLLLRRGNDRHIRRG
ncbi:uncharacterized protein H6S33_003592 [Morchella sextelata]|uniref:uncharacterized protein n=1 Tax=Morchella sextelata TaxID=1174677 RepID=UPI001D05800E|nr:uncharacterized protein H6S33_003592 [Morchella sextelata]KAH0606758.1 hypothetical protein H6S33_003592 [Morchella sextelata]